MHHAAVHVLTHRQKLYGDITAASAATAQHERHRQKGHAHQGCHGASYDAKAAGVPHRLRPGAAKAWAPCTG